MKTQGGRAFLVIVILLMLSACSSNPPAPVIERTAVPKPANPKPSRTTTEKDWRPESYTVKKGDTLYSIGLEFGYDYKEIAQWNNIQPPYLIHIGRQLKLKAPTGNAPAPSAAESGEVIVLPLKTEPVQTVKTTDEPPLITEPKAIKQAYSEQAMKTPAPAPTAKPPAKAAEKTPETTNKSADPIKPAEPAKETAPTDAAPENSKPAGDDEALGWAWPVTGKVLATFNDAAGAKGIDIGGALGQPVLASAAGKVVYSGAGLRGYGKLVIIKHNKTYLSAYAHNNQILVKEGQEISKGQKIAEMGSSDTDRVKLHFEIRKLGKPVDPAKYLPQP